MTALSLGTAAFRNAFVKSLGVILASEIGDKTFFIAAIMAMRNSRLLVRPRDTIVQFLRACSVHTPAMVRQPGQFTLIVPPRPRPGLCRRHRRSRRDDRPVSSSRMGGTKPGE